MQSKIKGKSIFITGANGGMGLETVKLLMQEDVSRIALACRTKEKAEQTKKKISHISSTLLEAYGGFDMNDPNGIEKAIDLLPKNKPFDVIFLQSGGMVVSNTYQFIELNGMRIEKTIFQNVLGGYLTIKFLKQCGLIAVNARIVFAGGEGARGIKGMIEKPVFNSVEEFESYIFEGTRNYNNINALGVSKFMSALLVQQLTLEDTDNEYIWFTPGLTAGTNGLRDVPFLKRLIMKNIGFPIMKLMGIAQSSQAAGKKYVDCLKGIYGNSGDVLGAPEGKTLGKIVDQKPMNSGLTNSNFRKAFWQLTIESCGNLKKDNTITQVS